MGRDFQGGALRSMPDPVPPGLQNPTLPSTSQRRETLWAYGSHHFPLRLHQRLHLPRCEHAALPTQLPPSTQSRAWTRHLHSCLHLSASAHPQNPPGTCPHPRPPLDRGPPLCLHAVGGLGSGPSHSSALPEPLAPGAQTSPDPSGPSAPPSCWCSPGLGPGRRPFPAGMSSGLQ